MKVEFGGTGGQSGNEAGDVGFAHMARLMESEKPIGGADPAGVHQLEHASREGFENYRFNQLSRKVVTSEPQSGQQRLAWQPHARNPILGNQLDQDGGNHRMNMEIQMAIQVIEVTNQFEVGLDLRSHFISQVSPEAPIKKIPHPGEHRLLAKTPGLVDDAAQALRGKHTGAAADHQMQADVQAPATIRLAAVSTPSRNVLSTAALTSRERPKSSAVIIIAREGRSAGKL